MKRKLSTTLKSGDKPIAVHVFFKHYLDLKKAYKKLNYSYEEKKPEH